MPVPTKKDIIKNFDICISQFVRACPSGIVVGCPQVAIVAAKALFELGLQPNIMAGKGVLRNGHQVDHIWVEIPEYDLRIETNPSQIFGYPLVALTDEREKYAARYKKARIVESPENYPALALTESGQDFFDYAAEEVVHCFRRRTNFR
jgi:hypothetical protein